jgi:hypothetical protein
VSLTLQQRNRLKLALACERHVRRALVVEGGERPLLAFEYDDRPESVESAKAVIAELVAAVAPALGRAARDFGFSAGGPEEIARVASGGEVVYERDR